MINWMQKHKKYLIPTIWISGIAFIGAGFVGWGAYDMNKDRSTSVAKVGNTPISIQEFHLKYNEVYNYLNSIGDKQLTQEEADKMGLDHMALTALIQETMLLNYAQDLGLSSNNEDVLKYIITSPSFQKDGKFDKELYLSNVKMFGLTPNEYENNLKKVITLDKLNHALNLPVTNQDKEMIASAYFMMDKISVDIITQNANDVSIDDNETHKYWENNKNNYMTKRAYILDTYFVTPHDINVSDSDLKSFYEKSRSQYRDENDKILSFDEAKDRVYQNYKFDFSKNEALKIYLSLKKGEKSTNKQMKVTEDDSNFPVLEITQSAKGEFIKPFEYENGNLIVKINTIEEPRIMSYEEAKYAVIKDYKKIKIASALETKAKEALANFHGKDIGYVSKGDIKSVDGLSEGEFSYFIDQIFQKNQPKGYVILDNKIVVYEITQQSLNNPEKAKEYASTIAKSSENLINSDLQQDLLNALQKRYKIEQYYKGGNVE